MPANTSRDSLFPSTSIGRAGSSQLQRVVSHESLNAHPLLSPSSPSSSLSNQDPSTDTSLTNTPRYIPYTPRHRPPSSSATTGVVTHSPMPTASHQHQQGGATSKLQLQNLKAAAQSIGLGNGTVGWAILEKLVDGETGTDWDEIWTVIGSAKPTLLLPLEPFSGEVITPEFVKDHIAVCQGPSPSPLITLSGLRGFVSNSTLTFQSTLSPTSKTFGDLLKPDSQSSAFTSLPPLPLLLCVNASLPSFALPGSTPLPLPPRFHVVRPPLLPRTSVSSLAISKPPGATRISNSFASLFGRAPSSSTAGNLSSSPSPSHTPLPGEDTQCVTGIGIEVMAFSVGMNIIRRPIGKELSRLIKEEIKEGLKNCPTWVVDRVIDFSGPLLPVPKTFKRIDIRRTSSTSHPSSSHQRISTTSSSAHPSADPSALADAFQAFYASIEGDLMVVPVGKRKDDRRATSRSHDDSIAPEMNTVQDEKHELGRKEQEEKDTEVRNKDILEQVESVICSVCYDRLFRPLSGDDASHDDALANRIAALNMLDLGLEHLGVEIPSEAIKQSVSHIVKTCGKTLQDLDDAKYHSPRAKSVLLVEAHKQIVDGLSRLPQLRLKPERGLEEQDEKTPKASTFSKQAAQEAIVEASASSMSEDISSTVRTAQPQYKEPPADSPIISPTTDALPKLLSGPNIAKPSPRTPESAQAPLNTSEFHSPEAPTDDVADLPSERFFPPPSDSSTGPPTPTTVSGDLLFPLLIFSVVKANPARFVSHLLYTQRFRSRSVGGQESYCLINLMAVVEFLEHVDMNALGLGDSDRVMSTAELTPIPLTHGPIDSGASPTSPLSTRLGKRVNQQVEELAGLAGSANKVITGVVDSSFGVLRGFLTSTPDLSTPHGDDQESAPWNTMRPGFGLLRRGSGFSIASVTASLPGTVRPKTPSGGTGEEGQQLIEVSSRPGSIKEMDLENEEEEGDTSASSVVSSDDSQEGDVPDRNDARSVRSFSSMMSESRDRDRVDGKERMSLTDRLASMSARSKLGSSSEQHGAKVSPPSSRATSRPSSWLPPASAAVATQADMTAPGATTPPHPKIRIPPPNRHFLECVEQDIRVGEVGELLREYRRMVKALRLVEAFEDYS